MALNQYTAGAIGIQYSSFAGRADIGKDAGFTVQTIVMGEIVIADILRDAAAFDFLGNRRRVLVESIGDFTK